MKLNLPNKLTLMRVILVPFFVWSFLMKWYVVALILFAVASITDFLDGYIARKNNLVTNFGKFLDPLADKVLVISALACFTDIGLINCVPLIIIASREFMVSGLRLIASGEGVVIPAGMSGKLKTAFTMVSIIYILIYCILDLTGGVPYVVLQVLVWISVALTIYSGCEYLKGCWKYIKEE
ncbi:MAG: CDP-diacylglycerol--glycerol-3-phosphate 3-phosphatidyltransferase [Ruminococcus sp.]|nr:CDP-diacylglycerol--glycerol-3-phosphate 3-phosphatidyltransferase [Ruminococcus sp.]MCD7800996.1 CDP-diacylglycerol--glycerol-3-phosphate 3-phosphatidyltransferase [Ruminococcus sp.]